jgi:hypothetical protein
MNNYDDNTTPEALLDLLHMGTQLRTTELRIQEALRAKHLITIFKVLISEDNADSSEDYSRVEKLLGMDKILPDQGVEVTSEKKWLKVKKSIVDRNRLRRKRPVNLDFLVNSLLYDKWRYIPEDDPIALNLYSLVLRKKIDEDIEERLQAMLNSSHLVRLLRELIKKSPPASDRVKKKLIQIQVRLEDDICYFFDQIDNDRTVPSDQVALSMRVCAESMRQLWPHVSDYVDEVDDGSKVIVDSKVENITKKNKTKRRLRTPGPLVDLFVLSSLRPLASFVRLFSSDNLKVGLTNLLERARNIVHIRLRTLRKSFGDDMITQKKWPSSTTKLPSHLSHYTPMKDISSTHLLFIHELLKDMYNNKVWGLGIAIKKAFDLNKNISTSENESITTTDKNESVLSAKSLAQKSKEGKQATFTLRRSSRSSTSSRLSKSSRSFRSSSSSSLRRSSISNKKLSKSSTNKEDDVDQLEEEIVSKVYTIDDIIDTHNLAWDLVGDMSAAKEPEAALKASEYTFSMFEPVLKLQDEDEMNEITKKAERTFKIISYNCEKNENLPDMNKYILLYCNTLISTMRRYEKITMVRKT